MARKRKPEQIAAFVATLTDPTSPGFNHPPVAYRIAVDPEVKDAERMAMRWLADPAVFERLTARRIEASNRAAVTLEGYALESMEIARTLLEKAGQGNALAAAKFWEAAGKAFGFTTTRKVEVKDTTPPRTLTPEDADRILASAERVRAMLQPNPLPQLPPPEDADYTVESAEEES